MKMRRANTLSRALRGRVPRALAGCALFETAAILACLTGCAEPAEPVTRHAPAPTAITELTGRQLGDRVYLSFALPTKTEDHKSFTGPPSLDVYWGFVAANATRPDAAAIEKQNHLMRVPTAVMGDYTHEGHVLFPVEFKREELEAHFGAQAAFDVRTRISPKRASEPSNVVIVRVFPAAAAVSDLAAKVTQEAVELSWSPVSPMAATGEAAETAAMVSYRIYREPRSNPAEKAGAAPNATAEPSTEIPGGGVPLSELLGESPSNSFRDTTFEFGKTYVYSVRSVVHYGANAYESVESGDSNLCEVTPKDVFPPAAPQGLVAVPVPATAHTPAHIELSWAISPENDLAGYNIYRREQGSGPVPRLNQSTLLSPAYRDITVVPGRLYIYTVTAVDRAGNESPASEPVTAEITPADKETDQ
jgi:hypothetical protein